MKKKNNKGFTLIELLAVVVILLAISVIAVSSISAAMERNKAKQNDAKKEIIISYAKLYYEEHKNSYPGGNGCILDCWNISRNINAGSEFELITNFKNLKIGDWAAFGGSKTGHIGIVAGIKNNAVVLQAQNQGSNRTHVTRMDFTSFNFLGAWRLKKWNGDDSNFLPARGYWRKGDQDTRIAKLDEFLYVTFPAYGSKEELAKLRGNYFGNMTEKWIREFQRRTNLQIDGCVGPITYAELKKYGFNY